MPLYVIRAGEDGPVKIGCAVIPESRRRALQLGCWLPLKIIRTLPGNARGESAMHERFAAQRLYGEWFTFHPDMLRWSPAPLDPPARQRPRGRLARTPVPAHIKALAVELGVSDEALKKWAQFARVPAVRRDELAALAQQRGVVIAPSDWTWATSLQPAGQRAHARQGGA